MMKLVFLFLFMLGTSSVWYYYLHIKTKISKKFLLIDNIIISIFAFSTIMAIEGFFDISISFPLRLTIGFILVFLCSFIFIMYRFWRRPLRKNNAKKDEVVSPADGNVIYIKKVFTGNVPISIKEGLEAKLDEVLTTDIIKSPVWLIGINMTPFDVHKNCAPVSGTIIMNKHIKGEFLSLKNPKAILKNERNTLVIKTKEEEHFAVVQTASKLVRRIDSYVSEGQLIARGDWFGMIRFGSQVDLIIPEQYLINIEVGQQIYANKTIIAKK